MLEESPPQAKFIEPLEDVARAARTDYWSDELIGVLCFGSVSNGNATQKSDVDIILVFNKNGFGAYSELSNQISDALAHHGYKTDIDWISPQTCLAEEKNVMRQILLNDSFITLYSTEEFTEFQEELTEQVSNHQL